jgi:hypothetical protein
MMSVNLADLYQAANIPLSAEDFKLRKAAFDAATANLTEKQLIDCGRIYFGWWDKIGEFDWFLSAFRNDPRFSFSGNRRESSVLAGALLLNAVTGGNAFAGLVVLAASVQNKRQPAVPGIAFTVFETEFKNLTVEGAQSRWYNTNFNALGKTSITKEKLAVDNTVPTMATAVVAALDESHNASATLFAELQATVSKMAADLSSSREQLAMLWWLTGGWSRRLKRTFIDIGVPLAYVASGFDLADLSATIHGPYSAEALLARVLSPLKKSKKQVSVSELGDSPSNEDFGLLGVSENGKMYPEICPLSAALLKSAEIGKGISWHVTFEKTAHLPVSTILQPQEIAAQAMYERLLLGNL